MINFEKIIKQKLSDYKVYSSEEENKSLWDSISDKLDNSSSQSLNPDIGANNKRKKRFAFVLYLFMALLVATVSFYFIGSAQTSQDKGPSRSEINNHPSKMSPEVNNTTTTTKVETPEVETNEVNITSATTTKNNGGDESITSDSENPDLSSEFIQLDDSQQVNVNVRSKKTNNLVGVVKAEIIQSKKNEFITESEFLLDHMDNVPASINLVTGLLKLPPASFTFELEHLLQETNVSSIKKQNFFNVRVFSGPTWSQFNYQAPDGEDFGIQGYNQNLHSDWSWGSGFMVEFNGLNQTWGVGIESNQYVHRLEYQDAFVTSTILPNQLLSLEVNAITGDTIQATYGPLEVSVNATRNVVHHNRLRNISIPLEWHKSWEISRWTLGVGAGVILHWRTSATGRVFANQEGSIPLYAIEDFTSSQLKFLPGARIFSSYQLAPTWSLNLSSRLSVQDYSSDTWKGRLWMGNVQLGLKHEFH